MEKKACVICAWRELCQKRFSTSSEVTLHCPDFVKDLSLEKKEESKEGKEGEDKGISD